MYRSLARPVLAVSALALLAACNQKSDNPSTEVNPPVATAPPAPATPAAPDFVAKAGASDMYEIQAAQVAQKRSKNKDVVGFAKMMVTAHTKSTNNLKAAITSSGLSLAPPATLPDEQANKITALNSASASDFDKAYIAQQVEAHQQALDLIQQYANNGDTPAIKMFAEGLAPIVQDHLERARTLQDKLSPPDGSAPPLAK